MISKSRFIVWTSSLLIFYSIFFAINVQAITVTVNMAGSGSGTITSSPAGITCEKENKSCTYQSSNTTDVTLIATPDANNSFTSWTGCSSSTGDNCIVHMNQNQTITATFEPTSPTISQIQAKFAGLNLGIGLGAIYWVQNDVGVADAQVINGIVRVTKTNKSWAGIILESHYFFTPTWGNINKCKDGTDNCGRASGREIGTSTQSSAPSFYRSEHYNSGLRGVAMGSTGEQLRRQVGIPKSADVGKKRAGAKTKKGSVPSSNS